MKGRIAFDADNWPAEPQRWLLQACLLPPAEAIAAWARWRSRVVLEDIDHASMRLLPMLHYNLARAGVADPVMLRYRGVYRNSWYRNQLLFHRLTGAITELAEAGVPVALLKGAALAHLYYPDPGRRPMSDGDLLVPEPRAVEAIDLLLRLGWRPAERETRDDVVRQIAIRHGCNFRSDENTGLDLHWRVSDVDPALGAGAGATGARVRLPGVEVATLSATDHLLHTLVHGLPWNPVPSFRWVVDARLILRAEEGERAPGSAVGQSPAVDWGAFVRRVRERELTVIAAHGLGYLREYFAAPVPEEILAALRAAPTRRWVRNEFRAMTSARLTMWRVSNLWYRFRRLRRAPGPWRALAWWQAYPRYLCGFWRLDGPAQIPGELARRCWGQLRAKAARG